MEKLLLIIQTSVICVLCTIISYKLSEAKENSDQQDRIFEIFGEGDQGYIMGDYIINGTHLDELGETVPPSIWYKCYFTPITSLITENH